MNNKTYKGIIFDFNGVLWWDTELQEEVWQDYASGLSGREVSIDELLEHVHGRPNKYALEYFSGKKLSSDEVKKMTEEKESRYRKKSLELEDEFKLSPGAIKLLDYLKENNIPRTIATASEINNITFFFKELDLDKWFDFEKVVYDDGIIRGKPFPDKYLKAAENIGLDPKDCIVIEDSLSGIKAASAANIGLVIGLGNTAERKEKLESLDETDLVISSFVEFDFNLLNKP